MDFAELQARSHRPMHMADWIAKLDDFLRLSDQDILTHAGTVSHQLAEEHAHAQYEQYDQRRHAIEDARGASDFDQAVKRLTEEHSSESKSTRRRKKNPDGDTPGGDA